MALRYLLLIGPQKDRPDGIQSQIDLLTDLSLAIKSNAFCLFTNSSDRVLPLGDDRGAIIGDIFTRSPAPRAVKCLSTDAEIEIARTGGRHLIHNFWGGYISVIVTSGDAVAILRDPSGAMPCYYAKVGPTWVIASDINLLCDPGLVTPEINWLFMASHFLAFDYRTEETGLVGVKELLAGFQLRVSSAVRELQCLWTPWDHVTSDPAETVLDQAHRLRDVVATCIHAWAEVYPRILLGLSGGLDSSIVAASLAHHADLFALTMTTGEGEGDERSYARAVADHLQVEMLEGFHDLSDVEISRCTSTHLPRPLSGAFGQSENTLKFRLANHLGIDAFFSGIGGDNVFCYLRSASPIVDRLKCDGPGFGTLRTLNDVCLLTGCSFSEAIHATWRTLRAGSNQYAWAPNTQFLRPEVSGVLSSDQHPWLDTPGSALPGKIAHAAMILRIQGTIDGFPRTKPPQINPLLSQPIVEACLSIPSWRWCEAGQNRSMARKAFSDELPTAILERRSKGGPTSFAYDVIDRNQTVLRDILIDGELVRANLLDNEAIRSALPISRPVRNADYMRLSLLVEAETWVRYWQAYAPRGVRPRPNTPDGAYERGKP